MAMPIDQSHRYKRHQAACREPAGSYDKTTRTAICFEHKAQYLLIPAPYTHIVVFWHISNIPPMISQSQISCNTPTLYIAAIFITRDSEVIMFSPCVFVCLFVCVWLSMFVTMFVRRFNYERLVQHKQYFAGTLLGMSSCASYVSHTHDVIDDVTRSQSRSNFEIV